MGSRRERGILKEHDWTSSWDSSFSHSIPSTGLRTLSSSRQSQYCSFIKQDHERWQVSKTCSSTQYRGGIGELGKTHKRRHLSGSSQGRGWWMPPKEMPQQKPRKLRAAQASPWQARKEDVVRHTLLHGGKLSLGKFFSWVHSADFRCSCYTISFQKYEGFLKINKAVMIPAAKIREKRTMRNTYVEWERGAENGSSAGIMLVKFSM